MGFELQSSPQTQTREQSPGAIVREWFLADSYTCGGWGGFCLSCPAGQASGPQVQKLLEPKALDPGGHCGEHGVSLTQVDGGQGLSLACWGPLAIVPSSVPSPERLCGAS